MGRWPGGSINMQTTAASTPRLHEGEPEVWPPRQVQHHMDQSLIQGGCGWKAASHSSGRQQQQRGYAAGAFLQAPHVQQRAASLASGVRGDLSRPKLTREVAKAVDALAITQRLQRRQHQTRWVQSAGADTATSLWCSQQRHASSCAPAGRQAAGVALAGHSRLAPERERTLCGCIGLQTQATHELSIQNFNTANLREGCAQRQRNVLIGVVVVDPGVTLSLHPARRAKRALLLSGHTAAASSPVRASERQCTACTLQPQRAQACNSWPHSLLHSLPALSLPQPAPQ